MGTRVYGENESEVFLGRDVTTHKNLSDATARQVDDEIRRIIDEQYKIARKIIEDNRDKIELMTKSLLEWETLDATQIDDVMAGKKPQPPENTNGTKPGSDAGASGKGKKPDVKPNLDTPAGEH